MFKTHFLFSTNFGERKQIWGALSVDGHLEKTHLVRHYKSLHIWVSGQIL